MDHNNSNPGKPKGEILGELESIKGLLETVETLVPENEEDGCEIPVLQDVVSANSAPAEEPPPIAAEPPALATSTVEEEPVHIDIGLAGNGASLDNPTQILDARVEPDVEQSEGDDEHSLESQLDADLQTMVEHGFDLDEQLLPTLDNSAAAEPPAMDITPAPVSDEKSADSLLSWTGVRKATEQHDEVPAPAETIEAPLETTTEVSVFSRETTIASLDDIDDDEPLFQDDLPDDLELELDDAELSELKDLAIDFDDGIDFVSATATQGSDLEALDTDLDISQTPNETLAPASDEPTLELAPLSDEQLSMDSPAPLETPVEAALDVSDMPAPDLSLEPLAGEPASDMPDTPEQHDTIEFEPVALEARAEAVVELEAEAEAEAEAEQAISAQTLEQLVDEVIAEQIPQMKQALMSRLSGLLDKP